MDGIDKRRYPLCQEEFCPYQGEFCPFRDKKTYRCTYNDSVE